MRKLIELNPCSVKNATDITDNFEQLKDVVLKQGRSIKFKSLLKENYWKYLSDIINLRWTRDI